MDLLPSSTIGLRQPGQIGTVGELRRRVSLLVVTVKPGLLTHDPQRRACRFCLAFVFRLLISNAPPKRPHRRGNNRSGISVPAFLERNQGREYCTAHDSMERGETSLGRIRLGSTCVVAGADSTGEGAPSDDER